MSVLAVASELSLAEVPRDDAELVAAARRGDTESFAELVRRYQALACAVAYSATRDLSVAEDIAQEAFVTAWTQLGRLEETDKFRAWLAGIVRNTARYWRRHQKRHAPRAEAGLTAVEGLAAAEPSPLERAAARQHLRTAREALAKIPKQYREALVLYYALDESYAEVASLLRISETTARQRLSRARKKLSGEIDSIQESARRCGKRAGAAAAVLLLIKGRVAVAAAAASTGRAATSISSKSLLALGTTGAAAALVCIASVVLLLQHKSAPAPAEQGASHAHSTTATNDRPRSASAPTGQRSGDAAAPALAPNPAIPLVDPRGEVAMGRGKIRDKTADQVAPPIAPSSGAPISDDGKAAAAGQRTFVRHGPAIVEPDKDKPLIRPDLDLRAVEREMLAD